MSNKDTIQMIAAYEQVAPSTMYFSGFFKSPPMNFHTSEDVEIDIERDDEEIAIVVQDLSAGYRSNSTDLFTNKRFKPPIFKELVALNSHDLINRMPGDNPFKSPNFRANVITRMFSGMSKVEKKIRRSMELQASQVLQTGVVTLFDENGAAIYELDYKPKSSHFPTAGTSWGLPGDDIHGDIESLADVIRDDGKRDPDEIVFGDLAWKAFLNDEKTKQFLDNRRIFLGSIEPRAKRTDGAKFMGTYTIGTVLFELFTYSGRFINPQTDQLERYMKRSKIIVRDSTARLDATFGAIPNIGALMGSQSNRLLPELPGRMSRPNGGMDMFTNVWLSPDGENLFGGVGARPLMIPTAIDTFGCLETGAT